MKIENDDNSEHDSHQIGKSFSRRIIDCTKKFLELREHEVLLRTELPLNEPVPRKFKQFIYNFTHSVARTFNLQSVRTASDPQLSGFNCRAQGDYIEYDETIVPLETSDKIDQSFWVSKICVRYYGFNSNVELILRFLLNPQYIQNSAERESILDDIKQRLLKEYSFQTTSIQVLQAGSAQEVGDVYASIFLVENVKDTDEKKDIDNEANIISQGMMLLHTFKQISTHINKHVPTDVLEKKPTYQRFTF